VTRQTIISAATAIIPQQKSQHRPWLTAQTLAIVEENKTARLKGDLSEWRRLRGVYKAKSKIDLENFHSTIADEAEDGFRKNNLKPAYRAIKRLRGGNKGGCSNIPVAKLDGSICATPQESDDRWREHYQVALNHPPATYSADLEDAASSASPDPNISTDAPTLVEVTRAIRRLKNGKAAGPDGIASELLKFAEEPISKALHKLFITVWSSGRVPAEWKEGIIVSLYKGKGSRDNCSNYRPISLLSIPGKVFSHVLLARIQPLLNKNRRLQQSGFTAGRSTMDAILALRLLAELHRAFNRPLHVAYIDVKSAFDSVDRSALWKTLLATGMPPSLLQLIRDLHTGTTARIRTQNGLSPSFDTSSGVRQRCMLAPDLFCSVIDWLMLLLMQLCPDNLGVDVGGFLFTDIDYADDAALLTEDPDNWRDVLNCYEAAACSMGLHTNWLKTKLQNIGAGLNPDPVSMCNQRVEPVKKFTYLGSDVDSEGYSTPEIRRRLGMANSIMGQLDPIWKQKRLSLQTRLRLYSSLTLSVLLYGSETWTLRKMDMDKLQSFHMMSQRRILGIRWFDHVTNISIQEVTGLTNLPLIIADRRHALFGHVCRLPPEAPAHRALQLCINVLGGDRPTPEWSRPRGRPRRMWIHQMEEDFGGPVSAAYVAAQDLSNWRSLRPSAGHARQ
jgi:Reverse transcriptase (RNA-dependent DNA polymerase)